MLKKFVTTVPFAHVRHSNAPCYRQEGFGGRPIEEWPVYGFFRQYLSGETEAATENFVRWYEDQLNKYHTTLKSRGGMYRGSLYQFIEKQSGASFDSVSGDTKRSIIFKRVLQRFKLLNDIKNHGYKPEKAEQIEAVQKNGLVFLCGGHHRAAALRALGHDKLPCVLVFPHPLLYNVYNYLRRWRHGEI